MARDCKSLQINHEYYKCTCQISNIQVGCYDIEKKTIFDIDIEKILIISNISIFAVVSS